MVLVTEIILIQYIPVVGCSDGGLNTISWYFNLQGSVIDGTFVPIGEYDCLPFQISMLMIT